LGISFTKTQHPLPDSLFFKQKRTHVLAEGVVFLFKGYTEGESGYGGERGMEVNFEKIVPIRDCSILIGTGSFNRF